MKKFLCALAAIGMLSITGCDIEGSNQRLDWTHYFDRAIIQLPNGEVVEGKVDRWTDFEDGDQLQIVIDGVTYLVHSTNAVLINSEG